ncbi:hypothetical protein R1flu_013916 [Riccia fluitans]|uniref:Secreted protein n=1 Tax=Riccia fluitans TaxID=41844 RepID=A0ABD1YFC0_9MARC
MDVSLVYLLLRLVHAVVDSRLFPLDGRAARMQLFRERTSLTGSHSLSWWLAKGVQLKIFFAAASTPRKISRRTLDMMCVAA